MSRRRFLDRTHRNRARNDKSNRGFNPAGMIRLAGIGAAIVIFLGVYIGFTRQGETIYDGRWGVLQRLITPLFFGVNALELLTLAIVGFVAWGIWRRMQGGK
tara:strand:+ start:227 stop:532 length:306 start_codon:yes stop_codon:yes gene_type:complete